MNFAKINAHDIANGPGVRVSLFVSGCRRHCPGCHNPQAWDFGYGKLFTCETMGYILKLLEPEYINGISILGGEPFEPQNAGDVAELLWTMKKRYGNRKSAWVYTGYTWEQLRSREDFWIQDVFYNTDVLVDGPYIEAERDISLKFRGSRNQRIIDLPKSLSAGGVVLYEV